MNLYYINLSLDYDAYIVYQTKLLSDFNLHTRFISNYFSKAVRKQKFKTDGTFNMISIELNENEIEPTRMKGFGDVIGVMLPFDKEKYEKTKGTEDCSYYLEMLEQGFRKASAFKPIPLETLLNLIEEFKVNGCKNEWLHKKKRFKEQDLEIILTCEFTTNYFQLVATINQISTKKELVKGIVIKTEPNENTYERMFKDILIDDENILITDSSDSPRIVIKLKDIFNYKLIYEIIGDREIKEMLSYQL